MISPSLFVLAWLAVVSVLLGDGGSRVEHSAMVLTVMSCAVAMVFEAGASEGSPGEEKTRTNVLLQGAALTIFVLRMAIHVLVRLGTV